MSTEKSTIREQHTSRRSSYDDDLAPNRSSYGQMRQRAASSENIFLHEHDSRRTDRSSGGYSRQEDIIPGRVIQSDRKDNRFDADFDTKYQTSTIPIKVDRIIESNTNNNSQRSTYAAEDDRHKYTHESEKQSYGTGTSNLVDIPIISTSKRPDSILNRTETPIDPAKDDQRRISATPLYDSYQRQNSREKQTDFTSKTKFFSLLNSSRIMSHFFLCFYR